MFLKNHTIMPGRRTIVITGAANGLGDTTSKYFLENGWNVIATEKENIKNKDGYLHTYKLDITSVENIKEFSGWIQKEGFSIDVLINNAGYYDMFPISESDPEKLKKIFEVNAFGTVNMVRAMLPFLVKSKGRVINISSISVRIPWLFQPYQLTKITQEALARAMRQELKLKEISLSIIRPGAIDTDLSNNSIHTDHDIENSIYKDEINAFLKKAGSKMPKAISTEKAARKLFKIATAKHPKRYYSINTDLFVAILGRLPESLQDWIVLRMIKAFRLRSRWPFRRCSK